MMIIMVEKNNINDNNNFTDNHTSKMNKDYRNNNAKENKEDDCYNFYHCNYHYYYPNYQ